MFELTEVYEAVIGISGTLDILTIPDLNEIQHVTKVRALRFAPSQAN